MVPPYHRRTNAGIPRDFGGSAETSPANSAINNPALSSASNSNATFVDHGSDHSSSDSSRSVSIGSSSNGLTRGSSDLSS